MAAKMKTMFGDVTDLQQRHHLGFPLKAKSFRNTAITRLVTRWGMTLRVPLRVKLEFMITNFRQEN